MHAHSNARGGNPLAGASGIRGASRYDKKRFSNDRGGQAPALRVSRPPPFTVGRGPVPRHCPRNPTIAGDRPPRYDKKRLPFTVGRGPVPRHATIAPTLAGETRSDARLASEGPRDTKKKRFSNDRGGQAPALRVWSPPSLHRRARACPSPCIALRKKGLLFSSGP